MNELNVDTFDPIRNKADSLGTEVAVEAMRSVKRDEPDELLLRRVVKAVEAELPGISTSSLGSQQGHEGKEF
jgi:hypothetical protein